MNLRRTRYIFRQQRNSPCKDMKSSIEKRKPPKRYENTKFSSRSLLPTPVKNKKSVLSDILAGKTSHLDLVTSTPIPHEIKRRSSNKFNSNGIAKLNSLKKKSCSITSSPIQKTSHKIKPCEIKLIPVIPRGKRYSGEYSLVLSSNKRLSNSQSFNFSQNSSAEALSGNVRLTRNSIALQSPYACKQVLNDIKMPLSRKLRSAKNVSIVSEKKLSKSLKAVKNFVVCQNEVQLHNKKSIRKSLASKDLRSVLDKSQILIANKYLDAKISQKSRSSLLESFHETDNSKSARYNLRNSVSSRRSLLESFHETDNSRSARHNLRNSVSSVTENKSCSESPAYSEKLVSHFPSTTKNSDSAFKQLHKTPQRQKDGINVEVSQHSEVSLNESKSETQNSKSSRYSLRLSNQKSTTASSNRLSNQDITKRSKTRSDNAKRSRCSLRLSESLSSKTKTDTQPSLKYSQKKTTTAKKQKLAKNAKQCKIFDQCKESTNMFKKKKEKTANDLKRKFLSFTGNIPIDDLTLSAKFEKRKIKSDGFKIPGKNTIKRKLSAIQAVIKADEGYEDDIYESKKFDQFTDLLMDTSESEASFVISTPKFPVTPLIRHKTPKFKDCFSPTEYAASRKAAVQYMYRNKKRKSVQKSCETPVIAEKKKLEYSKILEDAQKLQKSIESLAEEESDNDSYFSFT